MCHWFDGMVWNSGGDMHFGLNGKRVCMDVGGPYGRGMRGAWRFVRLQLKIDSVLRALSSYDSNCLSGKAEAGWRSSTWSVDILRDSLNLCISSLLCRKFQLHGLQIVSSAAILYIIRYRGHTPKYLHLRGRYVTCALVALRENLLENVKTAENAKLHIRNGTRVTSVIRHTSCGLSYDTSLSGALAGKARVNAVTRLYRILPFLAAVSVLCAPDNDAHRYWRYPWAFLGDQKYFSLHFLIETTSVRLDNIHPIMITHHWCG